MDKNDITITIVKLMNISSSQLEAIPIPHFPINEKVRLMVLQLNFDALRLKSNRLSDNQYNSQPKVLNLICDDYINGIKITNVADTSIVHLDLTFFTSFEKFSSLIADLAYADLKLSDDFWLPAQSLLTHREIEVLHHVYHGKSSKQIADALNLSARTVELHRQNCSKKIGFITPRSLSRLFSSKVLETYMWSEVNKPTNYINDGQSLA